MHKVDLSDSDYKGKFSQLDPTPQTRHKANKRKPRTRTIATSDCLVYNSREDYDNDNVARVIPRTATRLTRERQVSQRVQRVIQAAPHRLSSADLPALQNYEQDA